MEPTLQVRRIELFDRVVCAVDASAAGLDAARIAARATDPEGRLVLVTVEDPSIAVHAVWAAPRVLEQLVLEAQTASRDAQAQAGRIHAVETRLLEGDPLAVLHTEITRHKATLVVVGTHGHTRAAGIVRYSSFVSHARRAARPRL